LKRVLLTGAGGFVGRHALEPLRARGFEVTPCRFDLLDASATRAAVTVLAPTHLLHFAWYVEHGKFWTAEENRAWVGASLNLLQAFTRAGGRRAVMAGTCAEYDWSTGVCDEATTPLAPATLYGRCKDDTRAQAQAWCAQAGTSFAWGRIFHLYGPHEPPTRFVASVIRALLRGDPAPCTHGRQRRDFLHVADAADAFCALLDSDVTGAVNIGSGEPVTLAAVATEIARQLHAEDRLKLGALPAPPGDPAVLEARVERLRREVGWRPRYDLVRGVAQAIEWWRSQSSNTPQGQPT
jgi:nucleoside-diphosphate-sugar epimerase